MGMIGMLGDAVKGGISGGLTGGISGAISGGISNMIGGLLGPSQEELQQQQLDYQGKLMALQQTYNRMQADYTHQLNKDMWDYTNYENQVKHLKAAGLNPALFYGKGGAQGASTSGGTAAPVSAGSPVDPYMALNYRKLNAETALTEAEAAKAREEAKKIGGPDTEKTEQDIKLSKQELDNLTKDWEIKNEELIKTKYENAVRIFEGQILARMQEKYGTNMIEEIVDKNYQQIQNEVSRMTAEDAENDFKAEFWTKLKEKYVDNAVIYKVAEWRIAEEKAKEAETKAERDEWDFRQEKAFSDLVTDLGGDGDFARTLIKLIKFLLR